MNLKVKVVEKSKKNEGEEIMGDQENEEQQQASSWRKKYEKTLDIEHIFDTDYVKKMLKFHKQINEYEQAIGLYISSTKLDQQGMIIVQYFVDLFKSKKVKTPLASPIILLFDPELKNNKLDIKVSTC